MAMLHGLQRVKLAEQHQLYEWSKLDRVCAGDSDEIERDLKARQLTFALIPQNEKQLSSKELIGNFVEWVC